MGAFRINQRNYAAGNIGSNNQFDHVRCKSMVADTAYTFVQSLATQINLTSGIIHQTIENLNEVGCSYSLRWSGSANCKLSADSQSGSFGSYPITIYNMDYGEFLHVDFTSGTLKEVQLNRGTVALTIQS